jgi:tRNA(fMet)-specific endonuclease VapC
MRYLLDTTVLVLLFAEDEDVVALVQQLSPDGVAVSILTYLEAFQGVIEHPDPSRARLVFDAFFENVPVLPVTRDIAQRCAGIRSRLKRQGKNSRRRAFDLVIAATALEHGLELVTHNLRDFQDVPGLALRSVHA